MPKGVESESWNEFVQTMGPSVDNNGRPLCLDTHSFPEEGHCLGVLLSSGSEFGPRWVCATDPPRPLSILLLSDESRDWVGSPMGLATAETDEGVSVDNQRMVVEMMTDAEVGIIGEFIIPISGDVSDWALERCKGSKHVGG